MSTISVKVKKLGQSFERDTTALPQPSREYLMQYGFSQRMNDTHASIKRTDFDSDEAFTSAVRAAVDHALAQIDSGEFTTRQPVDPKVQELRKMGVTLTEWEIMKAAVDRARSKVAKAA